MDKSKPPNGFIGRDWSEEIQGSGPSGKTEETRPKLFPIPVSQDNGKTLDWSRSEDDDTFLSSPLALHHKTQREYQLS